MNSSILFGRVLRTLPNIKDGKSSILEVSQVFEYASAGTIVSFLSEAMELK